VLLITISLGQYHDVRKYEAEQLALHRWVKKSLILKSSSPAVFPPTATNSSSKLALN
jgi:hypothetical protein